MHIIDKGMFVYSRMPAHPHYCTHTFLQTGHATTHTDTRALAHPYCVYALMSMTKIYG